MHEIHAQSPFYKKNCTSVVQAIPDRVKVLTRLQQTYGTRNYEPEYFSVEMRHCPLLCTANSKAKTRDFRQVHLRFEDAKKSPLVLIFFSSLKS